MQKTRRRLQVKSKIEQEKSKEADLTSPLPPLMFGYSILVMNGEKNKIADLQILVEGLKFSPITITCPNNESFLETFDFIHKSIQEKFENPKELLENWLKEIIKKKLVAKQQDFKKFIELEVGIHKVLKKIKRAEEDKKLTIN